MRILIFVKNLDIGGLQRVAINLANYLAKKHSVHVVLVNRNITNQNEIDSDITIHELSQKKIKIQFNELPSHKKADQARCNNLIPNYI